MNEGVVRSRRTKRPVQLATSDPITQQALAPAPRRRRAPSVVTGWPSTRPGRPVPNIFTQPIDENGTVVYPPHRGQRGRLASGSSRKARVQATRQNRNRRAVASR